MSFSFRDHLDGLNAGEPPLPPEVLAEGAIPDELVDRMLDGEVDPIKSREVLGAIRADRDACERLDSTGRILRSLKQDRKAIECPDFSVRVLARVSARSGLFSKAGFGRMLAYRYAAAATLLVAIGGVFVGQRMAPEAARLSPQPTPLTRVVEAMPTESAGMLSGVKSFFSTVASAVPSPAPTPLEVRRIVERNIVKTDCGDACVNPPLAAILWTDGSTAAPRPVCKGRRCDDLGTRDAWATIRPAFGGVMLDGTALVNRESDVVFASFGR